MDHQQLAIDVARRKDLAKQLEAPPKEQADSTWSSFLSISRSDHPIVSPVSNFEVATSSCHRVPVSPCFTEGESPASEASDPLSRALVDTSQARARPVKETRRTSHSKRSADLAMYRLMQGK